MCTAATYKTKDFYMGRTLDYEFSYGEEVTVTPRKYPFVFRHIGTMHTHYAMIGMAYVADGYPLYYDAVNETGLGIAGLNFVGNARYQKVEAGRENIAQFEFIPWLLGSCATVAQAKKQLAKINLVATPYSDKLPCAALHWLIADKEAVITVECDKDGLHVYDNPVGVLTNNPPFPMQMFLLNQYRGISSKQPENKFSDALSLDLYSRGMGGIGLPGDLSSTSRFARVAFTKLNSVSGVGETESVSQFFHILGTVAQTNGCCEVAPGKYEKTIYTSCMNTEKGIYYYTTYENHQICAVDMRQENLDGAVLARYPVICTEQINFLNGVYKN